MEYTTFVVLSIMLVSYALGWAVGFFTGKTVTEQKYYRFITEKAKLTTKDLYPENPDRGER